MKRLTEWIEVGPTGNEAGEQPRPHTDLQVDNTVEAWGGISYAELSILLVYLRYLAALHQTHHWVCRGDAFYGDHKLFEELYACVIQEIDAVAEKAVGLGSEHNVNLSLQIIQLGQLGKACASPQTVPQTSDLAKASLVAEFNFLKVLTATMQVMRANKTMTDGVENMLQGIADRHEAHIYKLKRRCSQTALGF